uniref:Uncharacterized protein n=1 Tax=Aphis glycines virus 3 isolate 1 TaxID=2961858 RepID=A0A976RXC1_9VIRU|nr:hypothetical protein 2 [Aphis glycines virus 3 isolate 1]
MGAVAHIVSVLLIIIFAFTFYFNYKFLNNTSYRTLASVLINNYNYACLKYQGDAYYVSVNSITVIENSTTIGDVVIGNIGAVPVVVSLSTVAMSNVDYFQYTRVYAVEDLNGLKVLTCAIIPHEQYAILNIIDNLVTVVVLLTMLLIYLLFVRKWLCFGICSTAGYEELN